MQRSMGRLILGFGLILIGLAFVAKNLDLFTWEVEYYYLGWPSLLILIGIVITAVGRGNFFGFSVILVGLIFFGARYYNYPAGEIFSDLWPLFLIFFGLSILFQHRKDKRHKDQKIKGFSDYSDDTLDATTIFGEDKRRIISQNFKKAKITTIFGSTELDFTDAKPAPNCIVSCDTVFGGTEIIVPSSWKVINQGSALFGGTSDERRKSAPVNDENQMKITIDGFALFGGIEIKS